MTYKHFSIEEREIIQTMWWQRLSVRSIAKALNRSPASVSRELRRNFPLERNVYTPRIAHERALACRKNRGRKDRLKNDCVRTYVTSHLKLGWSPEQISGRMKKDHIGSISHEAIYQFVYAQIYRDGYGYLRPGGEDLRMYLRRKNKRRTRKGLRKSQRILIPKGVSIELRPKVVEERSRVGDWEGDSVESVDHKPGVNTLLERMTGIYLITRLKNKTSNATADVVEQRMKSIPAKAKHTLTTDNGSENSAWQSLEKRTGLTTYFAHPYSSHERGANENANGLLREYFPKKTDFDTISDEELAEVEYRLNTRPRKRLGYMTPLEAWSVALTG
jgi:IS30 family transposase